MPSQLYNRYIHAPTFDQYVDAAQKNQELWRGISAHVRVPDEFVARIRSVPGDWHLLILSEDWCGDAVNTVPVIAHLAELTPNLDCRILARDANPDLMDAHLTGTSRSIPVAIALDGDYVERGWWGPRPRPLQQWVLSEGLSLPKPERYREVRRWYARDHGQTTLEEVVRMLEKLGKRDAGSGKREATGP